MKAFTKLVVALALSACAIALPGIARAADFSGNWQVTGHMTAPDGAIAQVAPVCSFHQDGDELKGECKGPNGEGPIEGTVDGRKIVWHWSHTATTSVGVTGTTYFHGIRGDDGVIRGTWTADWVPGTGDFTGTKIK
jgi:hypothetical protein